MSQQHKKRVSSKNDPRLGPRDENAWRKTFRFEKMIDKWSAEVVKVQRCESTVYDGGRGFETEFGYFLTLNAYRRCFLIGTGGEEGLIFSLIVNTVYQDPDPELLHEFTIPIEGALISLRVFDKGMLMEIHIDPERQGRKKPVGDYWATHFRAHNNAEKKLARAMMSRVEGITRGMPDIWFKYRNFYTKAGIAADGTAQSAISERLTEGYYRRELGSGHHFTFTKHLATAPFLHAFGHGIVRPARPVSMDPEEGQDIREQPRVLRSMVRPTTSNAYLFTSLAPSGQVSAQVIKKGKVDNVLSQRETRRARRAINGIAADSDAGGSGTVTSGEDDNRPSWFDRVEIPLRQELTAPTAAAEPSRAPSTSSSPATVVADEADDEPADADWEVRQVLQERETSNGNFEYLVDWEPSNGREWTPSWEPEENLSMSAKLAWNEKKNAKKPKTRAAKSTRGRGSKCARK
ncbi:MAG: hypothetical protein L6R39_000404 [Caloplaca ligustica]|nr:MAG: hypothetical protein L6R39_000404 [Caloplaca ligustica]